MRHRDDRGERELAGVSVEVKRIHVVRGYFIVLDDLGAGDESAVHLRQHHFGIPRRGHVLVPVTEAFDNPGGLDIDKDRPVVRRVARPEHACNLHPEGIHASQVEGVFGGGNDKVPGTEPEPVCHRGAQHALAEHREHAPRFDFQSPETHVIQGCADNWIPPRRVPVVNGNGESETGLVNLVGFSHADRFGRLGGEIKCVHHQVQGTALLPQNQRRGLRAVQHLDFARAHHDMNGKRQKGRQGERGDEHGGSDFVIPQVLPRHVQAVHDQTRSGRSKS